MQVNYREHAQQVAEASPETPLCEESPIEGAVIRCGDWVTEENPNALRGKTAEAAHSVVGDGVQRSKERDGDQEFDGLGLA